MKYFSLLCLLTLFSFSLSAQSLSRIWEAQYDFYFMKDAGNQLATIISYQNGQHKMTLHSKEDGTLTHSFNINLGWYLKDWCFHASENAFFFAGAIQNEYDTAYLAKVSVTGELLWEIGYRKDSFDALIFKSIYPDDDNITAGCFMTRNTWQNAISCVKFSAVDGSVVYESESVYAPDHYHKTLTHIEPDPDGNIYTIRNPLNNEAPHVLFKFDGQTGQVLWQLDLSGDFGGLAFDSKFRVDQYGNVHIVSYEDFRLLKVSSTGSLLYDDNSRYYLGYISDLFVQNNKLILLGTWAEAPSISSPSKGPAIRVIDINTGDSLLEIRLKDTDPPNNFRFSKAVGASDSTFYAHIQTLNSGPKYLTKFLISDNTISPTIDISESTAEQLLAFPNPVTGSHVNITSTFDQGRLLLYDPTGCLILDTNIDPFSSRIPIPEEPGVYWLVGIAPSGKHTPMRIIR